MSVPISAIDRTTAGRAYPSPGQATIWSINLCDDQAGKEQQGHERGEICHLGWHLAGGGTGSETKGRALKKPWLICLNA